MARFKTRIATGTHKETGTIYNLGDTIEQALDANMTFRDFERQLIAANPQLDIKISIADMIARKTTPEI
jgi:hypothetical protein